MTQNTQVWPSFQLLNGIKEKKIMLKNLKQTTLKNQSAKSAATAKVSKRKKFQFALL